MSSEPISGRASEVDKLTVTRYYGYDPVKKQMSKVHAPHRKSGYIVKVQFEETVDAHGKPD